MVCCQMETPWATVLGEVHEKNKSGRKAGATRRGREEEQKMTPKPRGTKGEKVDMIHVLTHWGLWDDVITQV